MTIDTMRNKLKLQGLEREDKEELIKAFELGLILPCDEECSDWKLTKMGRAYYKQNQSLDV